MDNNINNTITGREMSQALDRLSPDAAVQLPVNMSKEEKLRVMNGLRRKSTLRLSRRINEHNPFHTTTVRSRMRPINLDNKLQTPRLEIDATLRSPQKNALDPASEQVFSQIRLSDLSVGNSRIPNHHSPLLSPHWMSGFRKNSLRVPEFYIGSPLENGNSGGSVKKNDNIDIINIDSPSSPLEVRNITYSVNRGNNITGISGNSNNIHSVSSRSIEVQSVDNSCNIYGSCASAPRPSFNVARSLTGTIDEDEEGVREEDVIMVQGQVRPDRQVSPTRMLRSQVAPPWVAHIPSGDWPATKAAASPTRYSNNIGENITNTARQSRYSCSSRGSQSYSFSANEGHRRQLLQEPVLESRPHANSSTYVNLPTSRPDAPRFPRLENPVCSVSRGPERNQSSGLRRNRVTDNINVIEGDERRISTSCEDHQLLTRYGDSQQIVSSSRGISTKCLLTPSHQKHLLPEHALPDLDGICAEENLWEADEHESQELCQESLQEKPALLNQAEKLRYQAEQFRDQAERLQEKKTEADALIHQLKEQLNAAVNNAGTPVVSNTQEPPASHARSSKPIVLAPESNRLSIASATVSGRVSSSDIVIPEINNSISPIAVALKDRTVARHDKIPVKNAENTIDRTLEDYELFITDSGTFEDQQRITEREPPSGFTCRRDDVFFCQNSRGRNVLLVRLIDKGSVFSQDEKTRLKEERALVGRLLSHYRLTKDRVQVAFYDGSIICDLMVEQAEDVRVKPPVAATGNWSREAKPVFFMTADGSSSDERYKGLCELNGLTEFYGEFKGEHEVIWQQLKKSVVDDKLKGAGKYAVETVKNEVTLIKNCLAAGQQPNNDQKKMITKGKLDFEKVVQQWEQRARELLVLPKDQQVGIVKERIVGNNISGIVGMQIQGKKEEAVSAAKLVEFVAKFRNHYNMFQLLKSHQNEHIPTINSECGSNTDVHEIINHLLYGANLPDEITNEIMIDFRNKGVTDNNRVLGDILERILLVAKSYLHRGTVKLEKRRAPTEKIETKTGGRLGEVKGSSLDFDAISKAIMGTSGGAESAGNNGPREPECGGQGHLRNHHRSWETKKKEEAGFNDAKLGKCTTCQGRHRLGFGCPNDVAVEQGWYLHPNSDKKCMAFNQNNDGKNGNVKGKDGKGKGKGKGNRPVLRDTNGKALCWDFLNGDCKRGKNCGYSHRATEIDNESRKKLLAICQTSQGEGESSQGESEEEDPEKPPTVRRGKASRIQGGNLLYRIAAEESESPKPEIMMEKLPQSLKEMPKNIKDSLRKQMEKKIVRKKEPEMGPEEKWFRERAEHFNVKAITTRVGGLKSGEVKDPTGHFGKVLLGKEGDGNVEESQVWMLFDSGCDCGTLCQQEEYDRISKILTSKNSIREFNWFKTPVKIGAANESDLRVMGWFWVKLRFVCSKTGNQISKWTKTFTSPDLSEKWFIGEPDLIDIGFMKADEIRLEKNGVDISLTRTLPSVQIAGTVRRVRSCEARVVDQKLTIEAYGEKRVRIPVDLEEVFKESDTVLVYPKKDDVLTFRAGIVNRETVESCGSALVLTFFNEQDEEEEVDLSSDELMFEPIKDERVGKIMRINYTFNGEQESDAVPVYPGETTRDVEFRVRTSRYKKEIMKQDSKSEAAFKKLQEAIDKERAKHIVRINSYGDEWKDVVEDALRKTTDLTGELLEASVKVCRHYACAFYGEGCPFPKLKNVRFEAKLKDGATGHIAQGFKQGRFRETQLRFLLEVEENEKKMVPWSHASMPIITSPCFVAERKGKVYGRLVNDYRKFNELTLDQGWISPTLASHFERMETKKFYCQEDLAIGYNEVAVHDNTKPLLAVATPFPQIPVMETQVATLGPKQMPAFFQRQTEEKFGRTTDSKGKEFIVPFLDDLSWGGNDDTSLETYVPAEEARPQTPKFEYAAELTNEEIEQMILTTDWLTGCSEEYRSKVIGNEFIERLERCLRICLESGFRLSLRKSQIGMYEITVLGWTWSEQGRRVLEEKRIQIEEWTVPETAADLESYRCVAGFIREVIPDLHEVNAAFRPFLQKKGAKKMAEFKEDERAMEAFESVKKALRKKVYIVQPDYEAAENYLTTGRPFETFLDASETGWSCVSTQRGEFLGTPRIWAVKNGSFDRGQMAWSVQERELFCVKKFFDPDDGIFRFCKGFKTYVYFDHKNNAKETLDSLLANNRVASKIRRWMDKFELFLPFVTLVYLKGKFNIIADAYSRLTVGRDHLRSLPLPADSVRETWKLLFFDPLQASENVAEKATAERTRRHEKEIPDEQLFDSLVLKEIPEVSDEEKRSEDRELKVNRVTGELLIQRAMSVQALEEQDEKENAEDLEDDGNDGSNSGEDVPVKLFHKKDARGENWVVEYITPDGKKRSKWFRCKTRDSVDCKGALGAAWEFFAGKANSSGLVPSTRDGYHGDSNREFRVFPEPTRNFAISRAGLTLWDPAVHTFGGANDFCSNNVYCRDEYCGNGNFVKVHLCLGHNVVGDAREKVPDFEDPVVDYRIISKLEKKALLESLIQGFDCEVGFFKDLKPEQDSIIQNVEDVLLNQLRRNFWFATTNENWTITTGAVDLIVFKRSRGGAWYVAPGVELNIMAGKLILAGHVNILAYNVVEEETEYDATGLITSALELHRTQFVRLVREDVNLGRIVTAIQISEENLGISAEDGQQKLVEKLRIKTGHAREAWEAAKQYFIRTDGMLMIRVMGGDLVVVPTGGAIVIEQGKIGEKVVDFRQYFIFRAHCGITGAAHQSVKRTIAHLRHGMTVYWPGQEKNVANFIDSCGWCRAARGRPDLVGVFRSEQYLHPFHTLYMDHVGPFKTTKDGYKYIFHARCAFIMFPFFMATKTTGLLEAAQCLLEEVCLKYAYPRIYRSDNAFNQGEMLSFATVVGGRIKTGTTYHGRSQQWIEGPHKNLADSLIIYARKRGGSWKDDLKCLQFSHRILPLPSLGNRSPWECLTGLKPAVPESFLFNTKLKNISVTEYWERQMVKLEEIRAEVSLSQRENAADNQRKSFRRFGCKTDPLNVGDFVFRRTGAKKSKVELAFKNSDVVYEIVEKVSSVAFRLFDVAAKTDVLPFKQPTHVDNLVRIGGPGTFTSNVERRVLVEDAGWKGERLVFVKAVNLINEQWLVNGEYIEPPRKYLIVEQTGDFV